MIANPMHKSNRRKISRNDLKELEENSKTRGKKICRGIRRMIAEENRKKKNHKKS